MVVVARVVELHPRQHPHVDVVVTQELLEPALLGILVDEGAPGAFLGEAADESVQLFLGHDDAPVTIH